MVLFAGAVLHAGASISLGQQPNLATQREAMKKLGFLVGTWSGEAKVNPGPTEMKLTQTEKVELKLDGTVMLVEGTGRNPSGEIAFQALATIAYDEATSTYRFRAYSGGRYLDTELHVSANGFSWGFEGGPTKITNSMEVNSKGEWAETTQMTAGNSPPRTLVEMLLHRVP
jgi:hypothetical protein